VFGLFYGLPVFGSAVLWSALALAITVRTGMPFALTWWSFTFPVGTVVTGTTGLAVATGSALLTGTSVALFVGLVSAWAIVVVRTVHSLSHVRVRRSPPGHGTDLVRRDMKDSAL
jgi:tellurite resistance protein TehA-like permease